MKKLKFGKDWVEVKDKDDVGQGDRKAVLRLVGQNTARRAAAKIAAGSELVEEASNLENMEDTWSFQDTVLLRSINAWSYGDVTLEKLDSLPLKVYDALDDAAAEFLTAINDTFDTSTPTADKDSPTGGSETSETT